MDNARRAKLRTKGWTVGSAREFLPLSPEEAALVELRLALSRTLRTWRTRHGMSQMALAKRLKSGQSRVAKMEAGITICARLAVGCGSPYQGTAAPQRSR